MAKKIIALLTVASFLIFTESCTIYSTRKVGPDAVVQAQGKNVKVVRVMKTSGEIIEFGDKEPGIIHENAILQISKNSMLTVEVFKKDVLSVRRSLGGREKILSLTTKDGKTYEPLMSEESSDSYRLLIATSQAIPLSEVELVWLKEKNQGASAVASLGVVAAVTGGVILGLALIAAAMKGTSCPFLYSLNGEEFEFEGEIFSGAVLREIERTDFLKLNYLVEGPDGYTLKISNEAPEIQYTDELKLLVIDHPGDAQVFPGSDGFIHTIRNPVGPRSAVDDKGTDFLSAVSSADGRMWSANPRSRDPENPADWKAGLTLEFPKPPQAKTAKLILRAGNTSWVDTVFARYYGLMEPAWKAWYAQTSQRPETRAIVSRFMQTQGIDLRVQVWNGGDWQEAGYFHPTGPAGLQEEILALPVGNLDSNNLIVRLDAGTFFWMIDQAAVDYTEDLPIRVAQVSPYEAVSEKGLNIRESLLWSDDDYYEMPAPGMSAIVRFRAPAPVPGQGRSFILKSEGYYLIHPQAEPLTGRPAQLSVQVTPRNFLQYSLQELGRLFQAASEPGRK